MDSKFDSSKTQSPWRRFFIGVVCLAVPVAVIAWWIYVAETTMGSQAFKVKRFLDPFPSFLSDAYLVTWIQLAFTGAALLLFSRGLKQKPVPNMAMLCLAGLIAMWLLFTMM